MYRFLSSKNSSKLPILPNKTLRIYIYFFLIFQISNYRSRRHVAPLPEAKFAVGAGRGAARRHQTAQRLHHEAVQRGAQSAAQGGFGAQAAPGLVRGSNTMLVPLFTFRFYDTLGETISDHRYSQ